MRRKSRLIAYIIFGLIAVGILASLISRPETMLIPLLVFGIVFLLYKFPPSRFRKRGGMRPPRNAIKPKARKRNPFRVIRGSKRDDDEPPRYH